MAARQLNHQQSWKKLAIAVKESDLVETENINSKHEHLITDLETSDIPLATTLRTVYEGKEPQAFLNHLDQRIKHHDKEIERMCNYHYQGFVESIKELLLARTEAENLKSEIKGLNGELQYSGQKLMNKGEQLVKCRTFQKNIASAIENLEMCLPVLQMYGTLKEQMDSKRYYPALKTLEQLEHTYLPRVSSYRFSQIMSETIPKLRERIKDASMRDLKDFLENIRKHSSGLGEVAMKHAAELNKMDKGIAMVKSKKRKAPAPPNPFTGEHEEEEDRKTSGLDDEELSAQDMVDFSPVYRCLHIYSVLGARDIFEGYYGKQRRKQARLLIEPPTDMHQSVENYKRYFHDIIGFFVVEDHILNTTTGLVNSAYMDELWEMALSKIASALRKQTGYITDSTLVLQVKNLIVLFCHTLRSYGFNVFLLFDLLLELRDQYNEVIMQKWVKIFQAIFQEDNYTPITVEDEEEFLAVVEKYPFNDDEMDVCKYPRKFPFSRFVPKIYDQVKEYIYACLKFSEGLHLSHTEIDDMVRKSANVLLTRTLSGCLSELIRRPHLSLLQLIQISINMVNLEKSCGSLEDFISNITGADRDSIHVARLAGTSMFKDSRSEAEEQIYKQLNVKLDEFMELANYDWNVTDSKGSASDYIIDLIGFLNTTFLSFTNLPRKVAQTACMSACKHIAGSLKSFLFDEMLMSISLGALQQFSLDLMQCEVFAQSVPVKGIKGSTLQMAFMDLRQLVDLITGWDWSTYFVEYGKESSKYIRVQPSVAIMILEKMKDADKKKSLNIFTTFRKDERDRKKLLDTVLKQLKGLVLNSENQN